MSQHTKGQVFGGPKPDGPRLPYLVETRSPHSGFLPTSAPQQRSFPAPDVGGWGPTSCDAGLCSAGAWAAWTLLSLAVGPALAPSCSSGSPASRHSPFLVHPPGGLRNGSGLAWVEPALPSSGFVAAILGRRMCARSGNETG